MQTVCIIGAGQLGSRHLQALKDVGFPLNIVVIDPNDDSRAIAEQRYESFPSGTVNHDVVFTNQMPQSLDKIDLAIVATNSNVRAKVISGLLERCQIKYMILEKLLFQRAEDYHSIGDLFARSGTKAWVNCSMRIMPFYQAAKQEFKGEKLLYLVTGSQFGLVTNAIHYLDHIAYLTNTHNYQLDTTQLDKNVISSKRPGFLELNGTLTALYSDGSTGIVTCYPEGNAPVQVQIMSPNVRMIIREAEGKAWVSKAESNWTWSEVDARIPYQSEMTTGIVGDILTLGKCGLSRYEDSVAIHLNLLEPLSKFIHAHTEVKSDLYPFT